MFCPNLSNLIDFNHFKNKNITKSNNYRYLTSKKNIGKNFIVKNNGNLRMIVKNDSDLDISIQNFYSWLLHRGVYVYTKSTWGRPPHGCIISNETTDEGESCGKGLLAYRSIQEGEKMIEIPEEIIINGNIDIKEITNDSLLNEYDRLVIFIIQQMALGEKSKWKSYFDVLPIQTDLNLVFRWNISDLIFLKGSKILKATVYLKKKITEQFFRINKEVFSKNKLLFPSEIFNIQSFEWALAIIFSRAIFLKNLNKISLIPYIDLLNHNPFSTSYIDAKKISFSNSYEVVIYSDKTNNKYEQIFTTYGPKTNLELILLYGFILERNPFDSIEIAITISPKDKLIQDKKKFLFECLKTDQITFPLVYSQYPKELLEFLRLCILTEKDLGKENLFDFDFTCQNKYNIEKSIIKLLVFAFECNLKSYSKIFEDESIYGLLDDKIFLSRNQKIAIKQIKCEKKILNRLCTNFFKTI